MTHPDTKHMLELVEQQTGYRVSVDLISGIHEHAQMISAPAISTPACDGSPMTP